MACKACHPAQKSRSKATGKPKGGPAGASAPSSTVDPVTLEIFLLGKEFGISTALVLIDKRVDLLRRRSLESGNFMDEMELAAEVYLRRQVAEFEA